MWISAPNIYNLKVSCIYFNGENYFQLMIRKNKGIEIVETIVVLSRVFAVNSLCFL